MILLRVSDKAFSPITTFLEGEFSALEYRHAVGEIGDCSFVLDLANAKVTTDTLQHYNRLEVIEGDVVKWCGYIVQKNVKFNVVEVRAKELIGILKKRLVGSGFTVSGDAGAAVQTLLNAINAAEDTGINFGEEDVTGTVNLTFERQDALSMLQSIGDAVNAQFEVTAERKLNFKSEIGRDLSASVVFRYNVSQISQANILNFEVPDDGDDIVTKAYGKSGALGSAQEDAALKTKFGLLESFRDFRVANTQSDVDGLTSSLIVDAAYSPAINLLPTVPDTFNAGDTVRVQIRNKLIDLDDAYQIMEKSVKVVGREKFITVRVNTLSRSIVNKVKDIETRLSLLESNV